VPPMKGIMHSTPFDILKRHDDGSFIWLEAARDLPGAQARLQDLSATTPGEYFVFDQRIQQIVAKISTRPTAN
jgi:hypothetical protein